MVDLIGNPKGYDAIVNYLNRFNIPIVDQTIYQSYIFAEASIRTWETFFNTEFYEYTVHSVERHGKPISVVRAESYSLPGEIAEHVHAAFNTVHFPHPMISTRVIKEGFAQDIQDKLSAKQLQYQERFNNCSYCVDRNRHPQRRVIRLILVQWESSMVTCHQNY